MPDNRLKVDLSTEERLALDRIRAKEGNPSYNSLIRKAVALLIKKYREDGIIE
jgi:hypothetical protein